MTDEELKELRDKLDLCYQPGGKLVWSDIKKVLMKTYNKGYADGYKDTCKAYEGWDD